jgi:hypothetical protein
MVIAELGYFLSFEMIADNLKENLKMNEYNPKPRLIVGGKGSIVVHISGVASSLTATDVFPASWLSLVTQALFYLHNKVKISPLQRHSSVKTPRWQKIYARLLII